MTNCNSTNKAENYFMWGYIWIFSRQTIEQLRNYMKQGERERVRALES